MLKFKDIQPVLEQYSFSIVERGKENSKPVYLSLDLGEDFEGTVNAENAFQEAEVKHISWDNDSDYGEVINVELVASTKEQIKIMNDVRNEGEPNNE